MKDTATKANLKPCPFCGSKWLYYGHDDAFSFVVQCLSCASKGGSVNVSDVEVEGFYGSCDKVNSLCMHSAKTLWNQRTGE